MNLMSILLSKVIVSASSAAVALAFDAGGNQRQEDIWVADGRPPKCPAAADLTEKEAKDCLSLHGHDNFDKFIDACVSAQFS